MVDYINEFSDFLNNLKSSSKNTKESYLRDVTAFFKYLSDNNITSSNEVTIETLSSYALHLKNLGRSDTTVSRCISSLRCYYKFLVANGYCDSNPAKSIKLHKVEKKAPRVLSSEEASMLLLQPNVSEAKGCRDKAILEIFYSTGLKVTEIINLNVSDIDLGKSQLICKSDRKTRTISLSTSALVSVSDYIYRVRSMIVSSLSNDALFVNLSGSRLTRQGIWKILKTYSQSAGLPFELTPHTFRHTFAYNLLKSGSTVQEIQTIMGHSDLSSTEIYLQQLKSI